MKITTDLIVGGGLVLALILCIVLGGPSEVATNLSAGLVGYLGRSVVTAAPTKPDESNRVNNSASNNPKGGTMHATGNA